MISYARNREDVLLSRCFAGRRTGLYIDAGAGLPDRGSVTKHFYDLGWRGINIEPNRVLFDQLAAGRPEDTNLNLAVGAAPGRADFYEFEGDLWGLSTLSREEAERHAAAGRPYRTRTVWAASLEQICEEHVNDEIDFLSIDVEGCEREVVASGDWTRWRPRVVLVESTRPMTQQPSHEEWQPVLLNAGYLFAYFDGLNRFFVREEDEHLLEHFQVPVNVFDDYLPYELTRRITALQQELAAERAGTASSGAD